MKLIKYENGRYDIHPEMDQWMRSHWDNADNKMVLSSMRISLNNLRVRLNACKFNNIAISRDMLGRYARRINKMIKEVK